MVDYSSSEGLDVVIEGPHRGDIRCARLLVREEATVLGDVTADVVKVLGRLDGNVTTRDLLLGPTARPRGWFSVARDLTVAPGVNFRGCTFVVGMAARPPEVETPTVKPAAAPQAEAVSDTAETDAPVAVAEPEAPAAVEASAIEARLEEALAAELDRDAGYGDLPEGFGGPEVADDADEDRAVASDGTADGGDEIGVAMIEGLAEALRREVEAINSRADAGEPAPVPSRAVRVALPSLV